ncbi:MAG: hypothetical protein M3018_05115 [Actinomycetota bacterium]|nr:hypothetical protein [Actinomycetota bacterium]
MKRSRSLVAAAVAVAAVVAAIAGGATAASGASALPTIRLALNGSKSITVSGSTVSGAVNVVSTFTGKGQGNVGLVRLNPGASIAAAAAAVQRHGGDINYLDPYGALIFDAGAPGNAQTTLTPGNYVALNQTGNGRPAFAPFTVSQSNAPSALPKPAATVRAIEFSFRGASVLRSGALVRFENDGFLAHMIVGIRVKNRAVAAAETAALRAGKNKLSRQLAMGFENFQGPTSPGALQQEVINAKPGIYVLACFMDTQDKREHVRLGMERTIRIK